MSAAPETAPASHSALRPIRAVATSLLRVTVALAAWALALLLFGGCKKEPPATEQGATPDAGAALIVVLGSSTSAGAGPKNPENAWVPRYARYLAQSFPDFRVRSLAVGGQTTYHVQPSGFVPPPGRPAPSPGHNITAALALSPRALVINLPSNDAAERYSPAEQLANFERVVAVATAANVPVWVTTTQPRNFGEPAQLAAQVEVRDAILRKYAPRVIDFWTPFATPAHRLERRFDAGDGTHLNDAAHALLVERVVAAKIPQTAR